MILSLLFNYDKAPHVGLFISFNLVIPETLSMPLTSYNNQAGLAGSIFGAICYLVIAVNIFLLGVYNNSDISYMPLYFLLLSIFLIPSIILLRHSENLFQKH